MVLNAIENLAIRFLSRIHPRQAVPSFSLSLSVKPSWFFVSRAGCLLREQILLFLRSAAFLARTIFHAREGWIFDQEYRVQSFFFSLFCKLCKCIFEKTFSLLCINILYETYFNCSSIVDHVNIVWKSKI